MKTHRFVAIIVLVVVVAVGALLSRKLKARKTAAENQVTEETALAVETVEAATGVIERSFVATGTVEADVDVGVVGNIPGKVLEVFVDEGDAVKKGQVLVKLEDRDLVTQLRQAKAAALAARVRVKQAETGAGLQQAQTRSGIRTAEAGVEAAQAVVSQANTGATLQETESDTSIKAAEAGLAVAKARLKQAEATVKITASQTTNTVAQAEQGLKSAQARLDMLKTGARDQERKQAEEAVRQAKANLDTSKTNLDRVRKLLAEGGVSQQHYDAAKLQHDVALAQYNTASQAQDLIQEGTRGEQLRMAEAAVQQAKSQLAIAKANDAQNEIRRKDLEAARELVRQAEEGLRMARAAKARDDISREKVKSTQAALEQAKAGKDLSHAAKARDLLAQQDIEAARAGLAQAEANVAYLATQLGYTSIRAPVAGRVTKRFVEPGEAASTKDPVVTIVDDTNVYVRVKVTEVQVRDIHRQQEVTVTVDALGDKQLSGTVTEINPAANPQSRTFEVKVRVSNSDGALSHGTFARVTFVTERQEGVIVIPRVALLQQDGGQTVYVVQGGKAVKREVSPGLNDATHVAISEGLDAGEQVIVVGGTLVKPGQKVEAHQRNEGAAK